MEHPQMQNLALMFVHFLYMAQEAIPLFYALFLPKQGAIYKTLRKLSFAVVAFSILILKPFIT
jgi:hypothetical protein